MSATRKRSYCSDLRFEDHSIHPEIRLPGMNSFMQRLSQSSNKEQNQMMHAL